MTAMARLMRTVVDVAAWDLYSSAPAEHLIASNVGYIKQMMHCRWSHVPGMSNVCRVVMSASERRRKVGMGDRKTWGLRCQRLAH